MGKRKPADLEHMQIVLDRRANLAQERTVLVHLHVQVPAIVGDDANDVANAIMGAIEVGSDHPSMAGLHVTVALAEEV